MAQVVTEIGRASFVYLVNPREARARKGEKPGPPKYGMDFIFDPSKKAGKKTLKALEAAIEEAIEEGVKTVKEWKGKRPKDKYLKISVIKDGSDRNERQDVEDETYEGMLFVSAQHKNRPKCIHVKGGKEIDPAEIYSGCYVRLVLSVYPYSYEGQAGVGVSLSGVMFVEDGEKLGGGIDASAAFANFIEDEEDDEEDEDDDEDEDEEPAPKKKNNWK